MVNENDRRPLASRSTDWAVRLTKWLARTSITPNQISIASMVAAAISAAAFFVAGQADGALRIVGLLSGAVFCQLRLICNLLDGMVAVEAGKGSPDGAFWNEFPDRISDILIFVGLGYGIGLPELGLAAAAAAVLTAYVRELGRASGQPADFSGPMAKPHRMATITLAAIITVFEPLWGGDNQILLLGLWVIVLGASFTAIRRSAKLVADLRKDPNV